MNKFNSCLLAFAAYSLVGCATTAQEPRAFKPRPTIDTQAPVCLDAPSCERMWLDAQRAVETLTRMRLRTVTDSRLETFAPTQPGRTGATVLKYPRTEGGYELRMDMECYRGMDCGDIRPLGINAFNQMVGGPRKN